MEMCWNFFWEPHGVFYILFCDSIYFLHSYYCCVIVEFLLPFSCLNENFCANKFIYLCLTGVMPNKNGAN